MSFGYINSVSRLQPIDADGRNEEDRKRRRVRYQGRNWSESEEDEIGVHPVSQTPTTRKTLYLDEEIWHKATKLFGQLTTIEEKIAQLFFISSIASYSKEVQFEMESWIQELQIGGICFTEGDYKRESYLISQYMSLSKLPLLFAHDFQISFTYFYPEHTLLNLDQYNFFELGVQIMQRNAQLGIHIQFDQLIKNKSWQLNEHQAMSLRRGIKHQKGIVGSFAAPMKTVKSFSPNGELRSIASDHKIQDAVGRNFLSAFEITDGNTIEDLELEILFGYKNHYDFFLIKKHPEKCIQVFKQLVIDGKIREEVLDIRVMKLLALKVLADKNSLGKAKIVD